MNSEGIPSEIKRIPNPKKKNSPLPKKRDRRLNIIAIVLLATSIESFPLNFYLKGKYSANTRVFDMLYEKGLVFQIEICAQRT